MVTGGTFTARDKGVVASLRFIRCSSARRRLLPRPRLTESAQAAPHGAAAVVMVGVDGLRLHHGTSAENSV